MTQARFSVLSAKARELARRLACLENRPIGDILERALEVYAEREATGESPRDFYARLKAYGDSDVDLEAVIRQERRPYSGQDTE